MPPPAHYSHSILSHILYLDSTCLVLFSHLTLPVPLVAVNNFLAVSSFTFYAALYTSPSEK